MTRLLAVMLAAVMLSGCAAIRERLLGEPARPAWEVYSERPGSGGVSETDALLQYYKHVRSMPEAAREAEGEALRTLIGTQRSSFNLVRYALYLSLPESPQRDESRALAMLEEAMRTNAQADTSLSRLARYLHDVVAQQREQQRTAEAQESRLREAQRRGDEQQRRAEDLQRRTDAAQRRGDDQERRADELEAKLNALKKIEKSLIHRERR